MSRTAFISLNLKKKDKMNRTLFSKLEWQAHIRNVIGISQLLLVLIFLFGCAVTPVSVAPIPIPYNVPIIDEYIPALGLSTNIYGRSSVIAITSNANDILMACSQVRFTGEIFLFKNFNYSQPMTVIKAGSNPTSMTFAPDRQEMLMVVKGLSSSLQIWNTETWERTSKLKGISKAIYSPDGNDILVIHKQEVQRLDARNLKTIWTIPLPDKTVISAMTISLDSQKLAIAYGRTIREIGVQNGNEICETATLVTNCKEYAISQLQYTPDSTKLLVSIRNCSQTQNASVNSRLLLLDSGTLSMVQELDHLDLFALSPDGKKLVSIKSDWVTVWSFPDITPLMLVRATGILREFVWAPDSKSLLIVGDYMPVSSENPVITFPMDLGLAGLVISTFSPNNASLQVINTGQYKNPHYIRRYPIIIETDKAIESDLSITESDVDKNR